MKDSFWQKLFASLLVLFVVTLSFGKVSFAVEQSQKASRVIMVIVDKITIDDYEDNTLEHIKSLTQKGSVGLLNNNTGAGIYSEHTYPSIGGGAHLVGTDEGNYAFAEREKIVDAFGSEEYQSRTGWQAPAGSAVQLGLGKLARLNNELRYPAIPGALGQAIRDAGYQTAVIGNADTREKHRRLATTITMDQKGITDFSAIDRAILTEKKTRLGSFRTDFTKVLQRMEEYRKAGASLIVIETGDMTRIFESRGVALDKAYNQQRRTALVEIDRFVDSLTKQMDFDQEILLVVTPTPTSEALKESKNLTPIFAVGPGFEPGTLLTSGTTKRDGIIMNTDIAPTILKSFGLQPVAEMSGRPFVSSAVLPQGDSIDYLKNVNDRLITTYQGRAPLQSAYVLVQIIVLFMGLFGIFFKRHMAEHIKPFLLVIMAVPLAELLMPLLPVQSVALLAIQLIITTLLIAGIAILMQRKFNLDPFIFICIATAGTILIDVVNASYLQKQSLLGYDPIVGARFYGIGNEYMGVLIGSLIIGTTAAIQSWSNCRKPLIVITGIAYLFTIYALAAPFLGTNVGGTIAGTAALVVTFLLLYNVRFGLRTVIMVAGIVAMAVLAFIAFDLSRPPELRSHMGTTASLILHSGPGQALDIMQRKWAMNMKLLRYTVWSRVLLASLAVLALLFYRPRGVMQNIRIKYPYLYKGFIGVVVGALVAFAVNDSGVVAAATTMIFGAPPLVYLVLSEQKYGDKHKIS
ncbi:hypothetical protein [Desulforamulus aeronauticus]|uniref:Uncharacterized protein n=1 Tax=Desulforamulus aeronauticus DSM 10349 TaxID=1121421 RepID=A0A1M6PXT7_9FIRM|nr:hypothetical protein [Desulforamulus aeronauticus]SHK12759.1 hypothetical protein SAMN02745123_00781 [Desulforamulus aeronauticus DSM 10349]